MDPGSGSLRRRRQRRGVDTAGTVETLSAGRFSTHFEQRRVKISRQGARSTYDIWLPPPDLGVGRTGPAVLLADPHAGVDWTGEPIDTDARQRAGSDDFVMLADVHGPPHPNGTQL